MCGKVVRKEGYSTKYKPDVHNTTIIFCRLSVYCERVWENVHACDFTHSRKLHQRIFRIILHYSTVAQYPHKIRAS